MAQTDEHVVKLRDACRKELAQAPASQAVALPKSKFAVDGISLGSIAPTELDNYSDFQCGPSELFAGLTWCQLAEREGSGRRERSVSTSVLHTQDGRAAYVNQASDPPGFNAAGIEKELERISARFGAPANVLRIPQRDGLPSAIIASWGTIKLEPLDAASVETVATGASPRKGLLADFLGNFQRSAKLGLPIYRLSSGAGYVWLASADRNGRGYQRSLVFDADLAASPSAPESKTAAAPPADAAAADPDKATADNAAADKAAADKAAADKAAAEKVAALNIAAETAAAEKAAAERAAADQAAAEKAAALKAAAEKSAAEKSAADKAAADKAVAEQAAAAKAATDQAAAEKAAALKAAADKAAADKAAADKAAADKAAADKAVAERIAAEKAAALKAAADIAATEKAATDKAVAERLAALQLAAEKATAEKEAALRAAAEKAAAEQAAALKAAAEKAAQERNAALKAAAEKATQERDAALKAAIEKAAQERDAALKAAAEKAAQERDAALKAAAEKAAQERDVALKAAAEKAAQEREAALKAAAAKASADGGTAEKASAAKAAGEKATEEKAAALKAAAEKAAAEKAAALKAAAERAAADKAAALKAAAEKASAEKEAALMAAAEKAAAEKAALLKGASDKGGAGPRLALAERTGLGESVTERAAAAPKVDQKAAKFRGLSVGMSSDQFAAAVKDLGLDMKLQVSSYQSGDATEHHLLLELMAKNADRPVMYADVRPEGPLAEKFASLYGLKVLDKASDYTIYSGLNPPQLPKFTVRRLVFYPAFFDAAGASGKDFAQTLLGKYHFVGSKLRDGSQIDQCDQCLVGMLDTGEGVTLRLDNDGHWALEVEEASDDFAKHFRAPKLSERP
ncbi:MAG: hypothetical protein U1E81_00550 [Xanthobacteraceae bacterium]